MSMLAEHSQSEWKHVRQSNRRSDKEMESPRHKMDLYTVALRLARSSCTPDNSTTRNRAQSKADTKVMQVRTEQS